MIAAFFQVSSYVQAMYRASTKEQVASASLEPHFKFDYNYYIKMELYILNTVKDLFLDLNMI